MYKTPLHLMCFKNYVKLTFMRGVKVLFAFLFVQGNALQIVNACAARAHFKTVLNAMLKNGFYFINQRKDFC